jgi:hypothetical protein
MIIALNAQDRPNVPWAFLNCVPFFTETLAASSSKPIIRLISASWAFQISLFETTTRIFVAEEADTDSAVRLLNEAPTG